MIDTNILYKTELSNMAPQRGFLVSYQPYAMILDVDLNSQREFNAQIFNDNGKEYVFLRDGPIKINFYQKYIQFHGDNKTLDFIKNAKFLDLKVQYIQPEPGVVAFKKFDFNFQQINLEKEIGGNYVKFKISESLIDQLSDKSSILMTKDVFSINPSYDLYLSLTNNKSQNLFYQKGEEYVISYLENKFEEYKLSGNIYRTKNGLRVILTDKIRDIRDNFYRNEYVSLMEEMLTDEGILEMYRNKTDLALKENNRFGFGYPMRLTPKLKNYSIFDSSYEDLLDKFDSIKIQQCRILDESVPFKFDLDKIHYKFDETKNEFLDEGLKTLQNLILKYLNNKNYGVCKLIKKIKYNEEVPDILKFVEYHDKWTNANSQNCILI